MIMRYDSIEQQNYFAPQNKLKYYKLDIALAKYSTIKSNFIFIHALTGANRL